MFPIGHQAHHIRKMSSREMRSILPAVAEQLFRDIQKIYLESSHIPNDLLIALKFVFGPCAVQALDLVDQRSVTCLSSPSGRSVFQARFLCTRVRLEVILRVTGPQNSSGVMGGSGRLYTCFVSCHYCPCPAFSYTVLRRNHDLMCKHILAIYLCRAMGGAQEESVSDQQMSRTLSGTGAS